MLRCSHEPRAALPVRLPPADLPACATPLAADPCGGSAYTYPSVFKYSTDCATQDGTCEALPSGTPSCAQWTQIGAGSTDTACPAFQCCASDYGLYYSSGMCDVDQECVDVGPNAITCETTTFKCPDGKGGARLVAPRAGQRASKAAAGLWCMLAVHTCAQCTIRCCCCCAQARSSSRAAA